MFSFPLNCSIIVNWYDNYYSFNKASILCLYCQYWYSGNITWDTDLCIRLEQRIWVTTCIVSHRDKIWVSLTYSLILQYFTMNDNSTVSFILIDTTGLACDVLRHSCDTSIQVEEQFQHQWYKIYTNLVLEFLWLNSLFNALKIITSSAYTNWSCCRSSNLLVRKLNWLL